MPRPEAPTRLDVLAELPAAGRRDVMAAALAGFALAAAGVAGAASKRHDDGELIQAAGAFRALNVREAAAWRDLDDDVRFDDDAGTARCRALSAELREAGEALAALPATTADGLSAKAAAVMALGGEADARENFAAHHTLVRSTLRDAARIGGARG